MVCSFKRLNESNCQRNGNNIVIIYIYTLMIIQFQGGRVSRRLATTAMAVAAWASTSRLAHLVIPLVIVVIVPWNYVISTR